jgi:hypothetical protein
MVSKLVSDGTTILRGIVGSTAYGLDHAGSDIDRLGLFVAPTTAFHGLHLPTGKAASRVQTTPDDYTEHEAGKYLALLLSCNPTVTELLWLPDELYEIVHPEGLALIAMRDKFLSAKMVRNAYLGYATQQFRKLVDRGDGSFSADTRKRTEKHARHLKRLCWQGYTLYSEGWLPIRVEDPEGYHEFGRLVAKDPLHASSLIGSYEQSFDMHESVLPESPDERAAEDWLLEVRARHYDGRVYAGTPEARTVNYITHLIHHDVVNYRSVSACRDAMANMTKGFVGGSVSNL